MPHQHRWQQVKEAWLAVEDDANAMNALAPELRDEVLRLRRVPEKDFLELSAAELVAPWLCADPGCTGSSPEQLGPWRLGKKIGQGGMATVYLAERADGAFDKQVAIKILNVGLVGKEIRRHFLRERQILARLDHPYIVRLLDGGVAPDTRPYLVTDYVDGLSLTDYVSKRQLKATDRIRLFRQICEAVAYAHQSGVVHLDLKPPNIRVTYQGVPKLLDFGISKLQSPDAGSPDVTQTRAPFLTWAYASPEQARGEPANERSDIYSLGIILCELLSGQLPYETRGMPVYQAVRVICENPPKLPTLLAELLERMLAKDPHRRPATMGEVIAALDEKPRDNALNANSTRRRWLIGGGLAGVAAVASKVAAPPMPTLAIPAIVIRSAYFPGLSPNGRRIAFSQGTPELLIRDLDRGTTTTIVRGKTPLMEVWSPDGRRIAFLDGLDGHFDLYTVTPDGRDLRQHRRLDGCWIGWMPDSQSLLVCHREGDDPISAFHYTLATDELRQVSFPRARTWGDIQLAPAPDGKSFAVARYRDIGKGDIYLVPMDGSDETRRLTRLDDWTKGLVFAPDGREIIAALRDGLMRVPVDGRPPKLAIQVDFEVIGPSSSLTQPPSLAIVKQYWRSEAHVRPLSSSSDGVAIYDCEGPDLSPDGRTIAFVRKPAKHTEIWLSETSGIGARPLARFPDRDAERPRWSPDGKRVAFSVREGDHTAIYVAEVARSATVRLTEDLFDEDRPSWSFDSQWVYFCGNRSGTSALYRADASGRSRPEQVLRGAFEAREAADGSALFFITAREGRLFVKRPGLDPMPVPGVNSVRAEAWGVSKAGVYYIDFHAHADQGRAPVFCYHVDERRLTVLTTISANRATQRLSLSADTNLTNLCWSESKPDHDILLVPALPPG